MIQRTVAAQELPQLRGTHLTDDHELHSRGSLRQTSWEAPHLAGPEKAAPETDDREDSTEVLEPPAVGHQMAEAPPPTARQLEIELDAKATQIKRACEAHDWPVDRALGLLTKLPSVHGVGRWSQDWWTRAVLKDEPSRDARAQPPRRVDGSRAPARSL